MRLSPPSRRHLRVALALLPLALVALPAAGLAQAEPPTTEFEDSEGARWTSHENELAFIDAVDAGSERVRMDVIGETLQGRPLQLVQMGAPAPVDAEAARDRPTVLFVCTQHGSEPAGREACLIALRDLAFTDDPALVDLLERTTMLFVPTANPDGRAMNSRGNGMGTDINRDHLTLETPEARAVGAVLRDWQPDATIDLHEFGPGTPVVYDDDVLFLWPRNLNVDQPVHDLAVELARDHIGAGVEEEGFTADEYGLQAVGDTDVTQTAGGGDEGIARNAAGLRGTLGILTESKVTMDVTDPAEIESAGNRNRRVASNRQIITESLEFMDTRGEEAAAVTAGARDRVTAEGRDRSAPVFFSGQDEDSTIDGSGDETVMADPPCGYRLTPEQVEEVGDELDLLDVDRFTEEAGTTIVLLGQPGEPFLPLVLDERGSRHSVAAEPLDACPAPPVAPDEEPPGEEPPGENPSEAPSEVPSPSPTPAPNTSPPPSPAPSPERVDIDRLEGDERVATAAAVSAAAREQADIVVLARSDVYADALAGAPLAVERDAPLLLSDPEALSDPTQEEIRRLGATEAVLLGGTSALSPAVEQALADEGVRVSRVADANRYGTAARIAEALPPTDEVLLAEGQHADDARGWPDALGASGLGAAEGLPVLLVTQDELPSETAALLEAGTDVTIVGGTAAVSEAVQQEVDRLAGTVDRLAGGDRYATSEAVAREAENRGVDATKVWLVTGRDWPDGLVAGAAAGADDAILLLLDGQDLDGSPSARQWLTDHAATLRNVRFVGGPMAISETVVAEVRELVDR